MSELKERWCRSWRGGGVRVGAGGGVWTGGDGVGREEVAELDLLLSKFEKYF